MDKLFHRVAALVLALCMVLGMAACSGEGNTEYPTDIVNGDFEEIGDNNSWVGWTKNDAAFNARGIVTTETLRGVTMEMSGTHYFSGTDGGNQPMRGTLTSDTFTLGGTGYIAFSMGAGLDTEKCYVEFFEEGNDTAIAHVVNSDCDGLYITDHLITKVVDLSAYIGKNIYIVITDNDDGTNYSYLNFDNFRVMSSQEEIDAANADYARQIEEYGEKPFEEDETSTTIVNGDFETGDLTGWKILEGSALTLAALVPTSQYYWGDRSVYGQGDWYIDGSNNGEILESATGAIRSTKFTLAGDGYISFMMGAGNGGSYVALCDGETDEELIVVYNEYFSDPALALTLLRMYMDASEYIGRVVYLKVVDANDGSNGGFAFINVDDFRVSLTADEVAALEVEQLEAIQNETYTSASYDDLASLRSYYSNYPYLIPLNSLTITSYVPNAVVDCGTVDLTAYLDGAAATYGSSTLTGADFTITGVSVGGEELGGDYAAADLSVPGYYNVSYTVEYSGSSASASFTLVALADHSTIANGDFEAGNLAGWTVLTEGWSVVEGQATGVISAETYWGEEMPYNQGGSYHLDGWNNGLDESATWQVQSSTFTLSGSGYISLRMGGHAAAVRVYTTDGTEIAYYQQTRFSDTNFPSIAAGGSWADMGTYVMDLSDYLGQELYIVLCDEEASGWAHAFFDEIVTYYETAPDYANSYDTVTDGNASGEVQIAWQLAENLL